MQYTAQVEVLATLSEEGFTLDGLVSCTRELFEREGMAGLIGLLLGLVDEVLSIRLVQGAKGWHPPACCEKPIYELHCREHRKRLRTSAGEVSVHWRRLRCKTCGQSRIPPRSFLGLDRWQSKTGELERMVTEVISEQSYRRGAAHLDTIGMIPVRYCGRGRYTDGSVEWAELGTDRGRSSETAVEPSRTDCPYADHRWRTGVAGSAGLVRPDDPLWGLRGPRILYKLEN